MSKLIVDGIQIMIQDLVGALEVVIGDLVEIQVQATVQEIDRIVAVQVVVHIVVQDQRHLELAILYW